MASTASVMAWARKTGVLQAAAGLGLAFAASASVSGAFAAGAAPAAGDPASQWVRVCGTDPSVKKEVCLIQRPLFTDNGTFLASVAVREFKADSLRTLLIQVPTGMLLQPGLKVSLDDKQGTTAAYQFCLPNACFAEMKMPNDFVGQMKKSQAVRLVTITQQGKSIEFAIGLDGFTAAYDGPPLDQDAAQKEAAGTADRAGPQGPRRAAKAD